MEPGKERFGYRQLTDAIKLVSDVFERVNSNVKESVQTAIVEKQIHQVN